MGYYHQNGDVGEASGSGASAGLNYDITNNLTAGVKVSYDDAFETRVMATINWSFADLFNSDEAEKEATTNMVMNALSASPEQRDVRVHDAGWCPNVYKPVPKDYPYKTKCACSLVYKGERWCARWRWD